MTIGPEQMIRILEISVRLGMVLHHLEEFLKEIVRVMWTRRGLGMVLHAERGKRPVLHALHGLIVEIQMRHANIRGKAPGIYGESMILRRDLHLVQVGVQHRLISTVVPEFEFERPAAEGEAHDLMTQANSKNRLLPQQL